MNSRAFSLFEMLVAVAIIAVLVAITIPAIGAARQRSEDASCASNLRQIGTALIGFAGENNGEFPQAAGTIPRGVLSPDTGKPGWVEQIDPYIGTNTAVYRCPSSARAFPVANKEYGYFMGAKAALQGTNEAGIGRVVLNQNRIQNASKYVLGGDIVGGIFTPDDADKDDYVFDPFAEKSPIHRGKVNLLFADGSVRIYGQFDTNEMQTTYDGSSAHY